ncbi:MAG: hypothetical protein OHK0052_19630 [Anaerolineales bacterium]
MGVLALAFTAPLWFTGRALFWGVPVLQFMPWWDYAARTLAQGSLPVWNPLVGAGAPLLANYQQALFYPPNWLYLLLYALGGLPLMAWGQAILIALHFFWGAWGMARLLRDLKLSPLAQWVGALAFGFSGYVVARAGFLSINAAVAWLPWILLFTRRIVCCEFVENSRAISAPKSNHLSLLTALALSFAMQLLAGHAQTTWYTGLLAALWAVFWLCFNALSPRERVGARFPPLPMGVPFGDDKGKGEGLPMGASLRMCFAKGQGVRVFMLAGAVLLAVGLAAVQLLPTAEYLAQSQRASAVAYEQAMTYSLWQWRLLGLAAPNLFGNPAYGDYWGYANFWEDALYIGIVPLVLALGVLLQPRRHKMTALTAFAALIGALALLLALGQNTPVFPWLYDHIPTFALFNAPTRWSIWLVFALALLAALGVEHWRRPEKRALYWSRLGTMGAFAVTLGAFLGSITLPQTLDDPDMALRLNTMITAFAWMGLWLLGGGALALTAPPKGEGRVFGWWQYAVGAWVALDLFWAGWGLLPAAPLSIYRDAAPNAAQVRAEIGLHERVYLPFEDEDTLKFERYFRFDTFSPPEGWQDLRASLLPNLTLFEDIRSANNFDPLQPGRYARLVDALPNVGAHTRENLLLLMGVRTLQFADAAAPFGVRFESRAGARLRWYACAQSVADAELGWRATLLNPRPMDVVIIEGAENQSAPACFSDGQARLTWEQDSPNVVQIQVESSAPGWLFLADSLYPGWQVFVDDVPAQILPAQYAFRAVFVPRAGVHTVRFVYRPTVFWVGLAVSGISLFVLFFIWRKQDE